jgi:hypothetical protein
MVTKAPTEQAVWIYYLTIAWAGIEAAISLATGVTTGSVALVAFGADSVIEFMSAVVVLSRLRLLARGEQPEWRREHRDRRILSVHYFALVAYVVITLRSSIVITHQRARWVWESASQRP